MMNFIVRILYEYLLIVILLFYKNLVPLRILKDDLVRNTNKTIHKGKITEKEDFLRKKRIKRC